MAKKYRKMETRVPKRIAANSANSNLLNDRNKNVMKKQMTIAQ